MSIPSRNRNGIIMPSKSSSKQEAALPSLLRYGNSDHNILRADGLFQLAFSLLKVFQFSETKSFEFCAEFFNLTTTPTFSRR